MITIPKPCHENWNEMTPKEKGRLCDKCCKVVVDFTKKTTSEIVDFLTANSKAKVCGRFTTDQVAVPAIVAVPLRRMSRARIFAAALMLAFGSMLFTSCRSRHHEPEVMGKVSANYAQLISSGGDTLHANNVVKKKKHEANKPKPEPQHLMGDVAYDPRDSAK